jgi:hypothetical protein
MEAKPLQPLSHGTILLVGVKASNLGDEIRTHPRVTVWDSQNEHWTSKSLPDNTRAVFMTRFIGHVAFDKIVTEARKRQITIFNPDGTGMITKQVKELLGIIKPEPTTEKVKEVTKGKLQPLHEFIDFNLTNTENARALMLKAKELNIDTTEESLGVMVGNRRKKATGVTGIPRSIQPKLDVSVEILDNMIRELKDMRDFLISTTEENRVLRAKMENFKKLMDL